METVCIIPARFKSTRFPGKLLKILNGREIILHVIDKVKDSSVSDIIVAVDDERIKAVVEKEGVMAVMTPEDLPSGTDRIAFAADKLGIRSDFILNVQGDEPFMSPNLIDKLIEAHKSDSSADIYTAVKVAETIEIDDPNAVKVVFSKNRALYFSRSTIPYYRDNDVNRKFWVHIGVYLYKYKSLFNFISLKQSFLEKTEKLEQLRALENDMKIGIISFDYKGFGIDTEEDLKKAENVLKIL